MINLSRTGTRMPVQAPEVRTDNFQGLTRKQNEMDKKPMAVGFV